MKSNQPHIPVRVRDIKGSGGNAGSVVVYGKLWRYGSRDERARAIAEAEEFGAATQAQLLERAKRELGRDTLTTREQVTGQLELPKVKEGPRSIVPQKPKGIESQASDRLYGFNPWTARIAEISNDLSSVHPDIRARAQNRIDELRVKEAKYAERMATAEKQKAHDENDEIIRARAAAESHWEKVNTNPNSTTADIEHAQKLKDLAAQPDVKAGHVWNAFKRLPQTVPSLLEPPTDAHSS